MSAAFDEAGGAATRPDITHIVMAARAYSKDEEKQINNMFAKAGNASYRVTTPSMTPFEGKDDIKNADIRVAEHLKDLFKYDLPEPEKEEDVDSEGGRIMKDASGGGMDEDEEDDGFFGVDKPDVPANAPVKRESGASRKKSSKYD